MLRNISGPLLALVGAVLAVRSPFRIRYGRHQGSDIRVDGLFPEAGVPRDRGPARLPPPRLSLTPRAPRPAQQCSPQAPALSSRSGP